MNQTEAVAALTEAERRQLATLKDPDATAGFIAMPEELEADVIKLLVEEPAVTPMMAATIRPSMFVTEAHRLVAEIVLGHYQEYHQLPDERILERELRKKTEGRSTQTACLWALEELKHIPKTKTPEYYRDEIKEFARRSSFKLALHKGLELTQKGHKMNLAGIIADLQKAQEVTGTDSTGRRVFFIQELANLPKLEWHVEKHFPVGGFVVEYGPFACGKSFEALDQALSIASGRPYLGRHAVRQGPVCYIAAEGHAGIHKRIVAWMQAKGVAAIPDFVLMPETFDLVGDENAAAEIVRLAKGKLGRCPEAFFIDTLSRNFGGGDENATQDMNQYVGHVATLGKLCDGATVVSIHHCGKDFTKGARGAVCLGAACDSMMELSGSPGQGIIVRCVKQKDAADFQPYILKGKAVEIEGEPDGSLVLEFAGTSVEQDRQEREQLFEMEEYQILIHLPELAGAEVTAATGVTQAQLEQKLGWSHAKVSRVAQRLAEKGKVQKLKFTSGATEPWLYYREKVLASGET